MKLCIFEDASHDCFYPLTCLRATFELRCGATTLAEKIGRALPGAPVAYFARDLLAPVLRQRLKGPVNDPAALQGDALLLVNGAWLALDNAVALEGPEEVGFVPERIVSWTKDRATGAQVPDLVVPPTLLYARLSARTAAAHAAGGLAALLQAAQQTLPHKEVKTTLLSFPWDLIHNNPRAICADFDAFGKQGIHGKLSPHSCVYGPADQVYVAPTAEIQPFVCIDTQAAKPGERKPVYIDEGVVVNPHTRIEGPCYIGRDSMIVGAKIREGCSIGPVCRVGGEVEESIIHGFSNKYHDGFLGHAYVCEWVNLGALTTNSDLKNDYSDVDVYLKGKLVCTGDTKVGCFIGDHTKTSIGTILNTGTIIGVMCNVMASGSVSPKFIPAFTLFLNGKLMNIAFKGSVETARTAMGRRKQKLSEADAALLDAARALTKPERDKAIRKSREHGSAD